MNKEVSPLWFLIVFGVALVLGAYLTEQKKQDAQPVYFDCRVDPNSTPQDPRWTCIQHRGHRP